MSEMQVGRLEGVRIITGSAVDGVKATSAIRRRPLRPCEVPTRPMPRIIAASVYHACLQIGAEWRARHAAQP